MTWSGPDAFQVNQSTSTATTVRSRIAFKADRPTNVLRPFECRTNFSDVGDRGVDAATNVPTWESLYRTPETAVYCEDDVIVIGY